MNHLQSFNERFDKRPAAAPAPARPTKAKVHPHPKPVAALTGTVSASDMMDMNFESIDFTGDWEALLGKPSPNFDLLVHGEPGSGKTSFLLQFAKYLSLRFGKVLYVSSEEFGAKTLKDMLTRFEIVSDRLYFANDLEDPLDDYDFVIVDSVNDLGLSLTEFKDLREEYPMTAFVVVAQHTKAGEYRGGKDWEHEVEIAAEVTEGVVKVYRNRYGVMGTLNIFEPIRSKPRKKRRKERD